MIVVYWDFKTLRWLICPSVSLTKNQQLNFQLGPL